MPPTLVCDFDGTLAVHDIGDVLCARFADASWLEAERGWQEGRLTLPEAQRQMWASVQVDEPTLVQAALEVGALRSGADELFEAAARGQIELVIASGGFENYIRPLLGVRLDHVKALHARFVFTENGPKPAFPLERFARPPYAICKKAVVEAHQASIFCGDGSSDRSVADTGVQLFAVRDSLLERFCNEMGRSCVPFDDFRDVLSQIC